MKNEKGFTLIEVLVALGLLGVFAAVFLTGIATSSKAILIADERTTAESLARSQMEYVKELDYVPEATTYGTDPDLIPAIPSGFGVSTSAQPLNSPDNGIQKITVEVYRQNGPTPSPQDTLILSTSEYKVNR